MFFTVRTTVKIDDCNTYFLKKIKTHSRGSQINFSTKIKFAPRKQLYYGTATCLILSSIGCYYYYLNSRKHINRPAYDVSRPDLPTYKSLDATNQKQWVTLGQGIYDISNYVKDHPGGEDTIALAAGGSLESFWSKYPFHQNEEVLKVLESLRVGNLEKKDNATAPDRCKKSKFLPKVDPKIYKLEFMFGNTSSKSLKLEDVKNNFPKHSITSSIPCKVNNEVPPQGPVWSGALLSDVLNKIDFNKKEYAGLQFECLDNNKVGFCIPIKKVFDPEFKILLAYEMNGHEISKEHGYPIRVVMPHLPGSQNVKWLSKIVLVKKES